MTELIKYDAACRMLAEAVAVDEVQGIRNQAEAMRAYARQAKDRQLEIQAAQIRFRAERRLGEIIVAQKETIGLNRGAAGIGTSEGVQSRSGTAPPTLEQAGIDRKLSSRAQRMAAIEPEKFEKLLERHRIEVLEENNKVSVDLLRTSAEQDGRDKRRALAVALSDAAAELPTGRKFPCVYADPPWQRKQGVTGRSYENHYSTMTWDEICAMPVADLLLPDAWVYLWIPRAHLLALHTVDMEFADDDGRVITRKVKLPLAWAVARAWGCDSYSTCYIWTKTDEEHPDDQGGGVLVFDQDEILLQFKRGRGLPKPATDEKFKSNHRERKREHSRKPDHYREMIRTMTGGVPVLELFARVDAEHPLPADWEAWGNQAAPIVVQVAPAVETAVEVVLEASEALDGTIVETVRLPDGSEVVRTAAPLTEFDELEAISRADLRERARPIVEAYVAQGLAFYMKGDRSDWSLTVEGWKRIHLLQKQQQQLAEGEPRDGAAAGLPALQDGLPESGIVDQLDPASVESDDAVPPAQRPGLNSDEQYLQRALLAIAAGNAVESSLARHLVGEGFAHATTTRLKITDEGLAWLASLAPPPAAEPEAVQIDLEDLLQQHPPGAALDVPRFLEVRE